MGLSTEDGLDWFKQAGIELTPEQEAQALQYREKRLQQMAQGIKGICRRSGYSPTKGGPVGAIKASVESA